jgi:crotonobetainyl-CoA:carnitine CoA-transferase CaiB-like acyl-CoA transferase
LTLHSIPFSEINSIKSLFENPIIKGMEDQLLGSVQSTNYDKELRFVKNPIRYEKMRNVEPGDSPVLGEHTE